MYEIIYRSYNEWNLTILKVEFATSILIGKKVLKRSSAWYNPALPFFWVSIVFKLQKITLEMYRTGPGENCIPENRISMHSFNWKENSENIRNTKLLVF